MADTSDIREWLKVNRPELHTQRGRLNDAQRDAWNEAHPDEPAVPVALAEKAPAADDAPAKPETPPARTPGWLANQGKGKPQRSYRRVSTEGVLSAVWTIGAHVIGQAPNLVPTARCLMIQAPAAGMVMDDAIRGTIVDKVLQPVARAGKKGEAFAAVVGPPLIVTAIAQQPALYPVLRPVLREMLASYVIMAGPKIRKAAEREEKLLKELGGNLATIDEMIESLFAPVMTPEEAASAADLAGAAA